ncbi:MAG TPA: MBL fold metallo-hydrolase [Stellaceae bacterium]|jgi:ribonuclease BN (tRNA processing enzyme)|nr:MBL fold metallo-hydrolase [Stellaceae bacterium]
MKNGMRMSRRGVLTGLAAAPAAFAATATPSAAQGGGIDARIASAHAALRGAKGTKLVLLGTGAGPVPDGARHMTSHVMLANGAAYVLDCGLGVTRQFVRTGIPRHALRAIFITHHHPDHNIEYGPFLVMGWLGGMAQNVRAYGPPPLKQMTEDYLRSAETTIRFWAEDFHTTPLGMIDVHDLPQAGPVMQDENVKVTSVLVQHPPVTPAYGYRFDFNDRSIAFSGDTIGLDAVAAMAKGADILVHEAIDMAAIEAFMKQQIAHGTPGSLDAFMKHMRADHTPTEEVGRVAQAAGVKTLVLSHLAPGDASVGDDRWRRAAATHFKGRIIVGHDLRVI